MKPPKPQVDPGWDLPGLQLSAQSFFFYSCASKVYDKYPKLK